MSEIVKHEVDCPHPDCGATVKVPDNALAGVTLALIHACNVRLGWSVSLDYKRLPYLTVVEESQK